MPYRPNPYPSDAPRSAIAPEDAWNAPSVFAGWPEWEAAALALEAQSKAMAELAATLGGSAQAALRVLNARDDLMRNMMRVYFYAAMSQAVDTSDTSVTPRVGRASDLFGKALAAQAFIEPELLAVGQETLAAWQLQEPGLAVYAHFFEDLFRQQAHVRSAEVEALLGALQDPFNGPNDTYTKLTDSDFKFPAARSLDGKELPLTQGSIDALMNHPDREMRRTAWEQYHDQYRVFQNTLAAALGNSIKQNVFLARARNYDSTQEMALFSANLPVDVYDNLIATFKKNLPTWHRYFELRKRILGVEQLEPYDIWAPLTGSPTALPFDQAVEWITAGLAPLGEDYVETVRRGCMQERWVDRYPQAGKSAGAFSFGTPGTHPFIMMSYTDDVQSLSTLAHELGHSMHSYLTWQHQPFAYSDYSMFAAETASNFHQALVRAHLLGQNPARDLQVEIIEEAMNNFHRYFLIMPTLARFELELHQRVERGEGLSAPEMNNLLADLFTEAYGPAMHIDRERVGIIWATFGHLYVDYYVFQYATGISAAHALAHKVLNGGPAAAQAYRRFLNSGSSLYPIEALKVAGVDMATPEAVETTFGTLAGLVERLEKLF